MKKLGIAGLVVLAVFTVIVTMLLSIGRSQTDNVRELPPLTQQELELFAQESLNAEPSAGQPEVTPTDIDQPPAEAPRPPGDLPRRLNRPPTEEERREFFTGSENVGERLFAMAACSPLGDAAYALFGAADPIGIYWQRAEVNLVRGNWDVARACLAECIRRSQSPLSIHYRVHDRQQVLAQLAWLEDDPELAARCLEAACAGESNSFCAYNAWELSKITGSAELTEHYRSQFDQTLAREQAEMKRYLPLE